MSLAGIGRKRGSRLSNHYLVLCPRGAPLCFTNTRETILENPAGPLVLRAGKPIPLLRIPFRENTAVGCHGNPENAVSGPEDGDYIGRTPGGLDPSLQPHRLRPPRQRFPNRRRRLRPHPPWPHHRTRRLRRNLWTNMQVFFVHLRSK